MGIYQNGMVEIGPSADETKIPRIQVRLMEEVGNYSFTISESKFRLLEKAILEKNSIEPKQEETGTDLGSLEVD
ncbi:conserved hypothetical protein [Leptospira interrogans serovar Manilae]|uniref:Uncharacterized protein n=1 Tax=Leptospira interrogans serovar Manilae TaxID=214675 RepID=A0AAQ1P420_LEPIR|nr:hypothetical protein [Leptospira interrogans]AKP25940.1 hypothetical protein LIMLP_08290 [Leptospira interrogans serovar Manilae]AKP29725.1 hypothetical protein LIMHP_08285 [Leptospira interrogans serovar Manilae]EYU62487.1 hypothetical protein CI00_20095 [Leptospira interrogans serovar Manilae]SOR63397.1 conserved hypothetical protein [Leptospira interrogans serovar Manilae]